MQTGAVVEGVLAKGNTSILVGNHILHHWNAWGTLATRWLWRCVDVCGLQGPGESAEIGLMMASQRSREQRGKVGRGGEGEWRRCRRPRRLTLHQAASLLVGRGEGRRPDPLTL